LPRHIDTAARKQHIAEATARVIARGGFGAVSVRAVAAEAELSVGSLRHTYPRQDDLVRDALERATQQAVGQLIPLIEALDGAQGTVSAIRAAQELCRALLPLDDSRREGWMLWSALVHDKSPQLDSWREASWRGTRAISGRIVGKLRAVHSAQINEREEDRQVVTLHAALDGLSMHAATRVQIADITQELESILDEIALSIANSLA